MIRGSIHVPAVKIVRLLWKDLPKIAVSELHFTKSRPETHFLRDFIMILLSTNTNTNTNKYSAEAAGTAKI